ncbi:hypothetical protein EYR38_002241 [Pleurotus pulmonarius]|nr:hypothetical protein EYR38_002241 [Pleurotus pulmonarius]
MDPSSAMHQEAVKAAVLQIRKGGEKWYLKPLIPVASSKLGSKIKYLFHQNGARILALKQPPGQEVLAALRSRFEEVGSILVSDALARTLASRDQAGALDLTRNIEVHTMLLMISALHRTYPKLLRDLLFEVFLPLVNCVHDHLVRFAHISDKTTTCSLLAVSSSRRRLSTYIPADSQLDVPDGLGFIPLPSRLSPDTVEDDFAPSLGCAGPSSRKRKQTADQSQETSARKSRRKLIAKGKTKENENTSPTSFLCEFSLRQALVASAGGAALASSAVTPVGNKNPGKRMRLGKAKANENGRIASLTAPGPISPVSDKQQLGVATQAGPSSQTKPGKAKRKYLAKANANGNGIASTT